MSLVLLGWCSSDLNKISLSEMRAHNSARVRLPWNEVPLAIFLHMYISIIDLQVILSIMPAAALQPLDGPKTPKWGIQTPRCFCLTVSFLVPLFNCYVVVLFYTIDPIWGANNWWTNWNFDFFSMLYDSIVCVNHVVLCHLLWYCMCFHLIRRWSRLD